MLPGGGEEISTDILTIEDNAFEEDICALTAITFLLIVIKMFTLTQYYIKGMEYSLMGHPVNSFK